MILSTQSQTNLNKQLHFCLRMELKKMPAFPCFSKKRLLAVTKLMVNPAIIPGDAQTKLN